MTPIYLTDPEERAEEHWRLVTESLTRPITDEERRAVVANVVDDILFEQDVNAVRVLVGTLVRLPPAPG